MNAVFLNYRNERHTSLKGAKENLPIFPKFKIKFGKKYCHTVKLSLCEFPENYFQWKAHITYRRKYISIGTLYFM